MSLTAYRRKRRFEGTPEPTGGKTGRGALRFVVQKHHASRLHYDFRLELGGTLKSWAVPKGPSLNPEDKRLAMIVEDHPLDYRTFEGVIPAGNYGAGRVIVWDQGTYHAAGETDRRDSERELRAGLARGRLSVVLHGEKLRGEFSLVKLKRGEANAWLLIKKGDEFASAEDVTADDRSVLSGLTLDDVGAKPPRPKRGRTARRLGQDPMPRDIRPMLATLVDGPFDRPGWLFELKWDGYRAVAEVTRSGVRLYSRNHQSFENKFAPVAVALRGLGHEAVLDGEVVVVDESGRSQFQLLQNYQKTGRGNLVYFVFDLLYLDGRDLRSLPLVERKEMLREMLPALPHVRYGDHVLDDGTAFFRAAADRGLEGIIGKDGSSRYREGVRSGDWVKIKTRRRQEAVIGGYTAPRGRRVGLGALVLGVYEGNELVYIGHTGGGLDTRGLTDLRARLEELTTDDCPFRKKPRTNAPVKWVRPELVCEVAFQEWTDDGRMRQPIFVGLREDKPARSVRREREHPVAEIRVTPSVARRTRRKATTPAGPALTNLDKVYWPDDGYTKGDLIAYYREMAPVLLPHLKDRPMSLHRHPNGIKAASFFQKDVSKQPPPEWVETVTIPPESGDSPVTYCLCQDQASLLYLANLACIELNPWISRVGSLERPDFLVVDLDPEAIPFPRVIEAALAVRRALEDAGAECLCKTSGKRGLHVCVPLGAKYDFDQARQFAQLLATLVHQKLPRSTSLVRQPALRQKRVYLDYLQNRRGQTLVAPYSVRPAPGAPVSTPLRWSEVRKGLDPGRFTIRTMAKRLEKFGDVWDASWKPGVDLGGCLERLARQAT
ncbi:MAG: DNA ligase D [Zavarzinella sp.]|nr:DNA ligase D [Zavarzinella sp.]